MFENTSIAIMYAVTPCHAGSGSALGVVDLPIQRERHTNWPMIQASGVKGAFRANFDRFKNKIADKEQIKDFETLTESVFGTSSDGGYAGSLSISDEVKCFSFCLDYLSGSFKETGKRFVCCKFQFY